MPPTTDPAFSGDASAQPITLNNFRDLTTILNVHGTLVRLEEKVHTLEITTKSNSENIDILTKTAYVIPYLEKEFDKVKKDLNDLGGRHNKEVHGLEMKIEKGLNDLGGRLGKDIKELDKIAYVIKMIGLVAVSGIGTWIISHIYSHH